VIRSARMSLGLAVEAYPKADSSFPTASISAVALRDCKRETGARVTIQAVFAAVSIVTVACGFW
jgi:hypothetical protein